MIMPSGFKHGKLTPELQIQMGRFEREMRDIQRQIEERKRERDRTQSQIKAEKDILSKENSQRQSKISNLEKEIRGIDDEIKKISEKYSSQIKLLDNQIIEANKALERATGQSEEFRRIAQEKPETETKVIEDLTRQKNQLQFEIRDLENKIQERKNKLNEIETEIQRASKKTPLPKGIIMSEPQLKLKRAEKERLEGEKNKIQTAINNFTDNLSRRKSQALKEKEALEKEIKIQPSALHLQKLETSFNEFNIA